MRKNSVKNRRINDEVQRALAGIVREVKDPRISHGGIMGSIPVRATGCQSSDLAAFFVENPVDIRFLEITCIFVKSVIIFIC